MLVELVIAQAMLALKQLKLLRRRKAQEQPLGRAMRAVAGDDAIEIDRHLVPDRLSVTSAGSRFRRHV